MLQNFVIPSEKNNFTPYLLNHKALLVYIAFIIVFNMLFGWLGLVRVSANISLEAILEEHNQRRIQEGISPLSLNQQLNQSAQSKAIHMLNTNCWSHYCPGGPEGDAPWGFFLEAGYDYQYAGENLAEGFTGVDSMLSAWLNSPTHRENLLNSNYSEIGIGIVTGNFQGKSNNTIVVVHFGSPLPEPLPFNDISVNSPLERNSSEIDKVKTFLEIQNPNNQEIITDESINVNGLKSENVSIVDLFINNLKDGRVEATGKNFTYKTEPLISGKYTVSAKGFDTSGEVLAESDSISVTVQNNIKLLELTQFSYKELNNVTELNIADPNRLIRSIEIYELNRTFTQIDSKWMLRLQNQVLANTSLITLIAKDKFGNSDSLQITTNTFNFTNEDNIEDISVSNSNVIDEYTSNFNQVDTRLLVVLAVVIYLIILFGIDYYVLKKSDMLHKVGRKSHLHVSVLILLFVTLLSGGAFGTILENSLSI